MPPKSRQTKLPRRCAAREGELNLESAAEERIDAITAEPLLANHFVEILSPDKTLRLFYNTSTLVRIAHDKGGFMQPPHFREPMHPSLVRRIEEMEGKRFRFETLDTYISSHGEVDPPTGRPGAADQAGGLLIHHRHVYFDQIMDEFYHLNAAEVYVCPVCYEHYLTTRYIPFLHSSGARVAHVDDGGEQRPVVDPLDVLCYMLGGAVDVDEADASGEQDWDTPLAHIVFRRAVDWKRHMSLHHDVGDTPAVDYRLRDVLCTYHNLYNRLQDERHAEKVRRYGDAPRQLALTQQRYWQLNARYNCLRYNRVVDAVEKAEGHAGTVEETAFPNEAIAQDLNPAETADVGSDFVVDDDVEDSGTGSNSSSSGRGRDDFFPRYEGAGWDTEEEEEDSSSSSTSSTVSSSSSSSNGGSRQGRGRQRRNKRQKDVKSCAAEKGEEEGEVVTSGSSTTTDDESDSADEVMRDSVSTQRTLYNRGLLKETDMYYQRLSGEDRRFVAQAARQTYAPSRLYDPILHRSRGPGTEHADEATYDDVDWESIGGDLAPATKRAKVETVAESVDPSDSSPLALKQPNVPQLLVSDDDKESAGAPVGDEGTQDKPTSPSQHRAPSQRLLLDDEE